MCTQQLLDFHQSSALRGTQYHHFVWSLSAGDDNCNYFRSRLFPWHITALWVTPGGMCAICLYGVITPAVAIWWKNRRQLWNTTWHWFSLHNSWPLRKKASCTHRFLWSCSRSLAQTHTSTLASASIKRHKLMWKFGFKYSHAPPPICKYGCP